MRYLLFFLSLLIVANGSWKMFSSKGDTFMYNEATGEIYRYYQVVDNKILKEEGMVRVIFTSYAKYPIRNKMVSPRGYTPKEMKKMEEKLIDSLVKE